MNALHSLAKHSLGKTSGTDLGVVMIRYVSPFILQNYEENRDQGLIEAYIMFFDIANFTQTGTALQKQGKKGAEELTRYLDAAFGVPIDIVIKNGGFLCSFAGDAFYAIFPAANQDGMMTAVSMIGDYFAEHTSHITPFGSFGLKVRQAISFGSINWRIFRTELQNEYVFSGQPLQELGELAACKEDIIFSESSAQKAGLEHFDRAKMGYQLKEKVYRSASPLVFEYSQESIDSFIHPRYRGEEPQNEIRMAAYCFINLDSIPADDLDRTINQIQLLSDEYGGFVNKYIDTDMGLLSVVLFGIPHSLDRTLERACRFGLGLRNSLPDIAIGITSGSGYAGFTGLGQISEYTALAHPVNLAARLMAQARPGMIITDHSIYLEQEQAFEFCLLGSIGLKGIEEPIPHYQLVKQLSKGHQLRDYRFVGRENEVQALKSKIDMCLGTGENAAIYVVGDAGIGKSRLVHEVLTDYQLDTCHKFFVFCDALLHKPLDAIKQIILSFFGIGLDANLQEILSLFRSKWQELAGDDAEMLRIESIIGSIIGVKWDGSVWDILPAEDRIDQLRGAFVSFITQIAGQKPVLIHLDDCQWLDAQSLGLFQQLSSSGVSPVIIINACRYLENGDTPDMNLANHEKVVLDLGVLSNAGSNQLISSLFKRNTVPDQTSSLICRMATGNPFFIEQLVDYLRENGIVDDQAQLIKEVDYLESFGINDIVGSRIDRLTTSLRELVSNASVLGMEFNIRVLSHMLNHDLQDGLKSVAQNRIWRDLDEIRYVFSHILIKDVVYQRMMHEKIQKLHQMAAEAMELVFSDSLNEHAEEIAIHYHNANKLLEASDYYDMAGKYYFEKYSFDLSERYYTKALLLKEEVQGPDAPEVSFVINHLASLLDANGEFERAEPLYQRSIDIRLKSYGDRSPEVAEAMCNLGSLYVSQGKYQEAELWIRKALDILESQTDQNLIELVTTLSNLATLSFYQGKIQESEEIFLRALKIGDSIEGSTHPDVLSLVSNLGVIYMIQGKLDESRPMLERAIEENRSEQGFETPKTAEAINNLASWYGYNSDNAKALELYKQALSIYVNVYNDYHPLVATTLSNIATVQSSLGLYAEAEVGFRRVIEIKEKIYGPDHPDTSLTLNNLAYMYESLERYDEAEIHYQRSLAIKEAKLGPEHPDTALALNNLGTLYMSRAQFEQAEEFFTRALGIADKVLGEEHQTTASIVFNLGRLSRRKKDYENAALYLQRALKIRKLLLGDTHPYTIKTEEEIAAFELETAAAQLSTESERS